MLEELNCCNRSQSVASGVRMLLQKQRCCCRSKKWMQEPICCCKSKYMTTRAMIWLLESWCGCGCCCRNKEVAAWAKSGCRSRYVAAKANIWLQEQWCGCISQDVAAGKTLQFFFFYFCWNFYLFQIYTLLEQLNLQIFWLGAKKKIAPD